VNRVTWTNIHLQTYNSAALFAGPYGLELLQDQPYLKADARLRLLETTEGGLVGFVHLTERVGHAVDDGRFAAVTILVLFCFALSAVW
jgi:hypothetical protein